MIEMSREGAMVIADRAEIYPPGNAFDWGIDGGDPDDYGVIYPLEHG